MPTIVNLKASPRARKRPGRDLAAVLAAAAAQAEPKPATASLRNRSHMAYNSDDPHREEHARALNHRARGVVKVEPFGGYYFQAYPV